MFKRDILLRRGSIVLAFSSSSSVARGVHRQNIMQGNTMVERFISRGFRGRRQPSELTSRIPPGQHLERGFPVLSAGPTPPPPLYRLGFSIPGENAQPEGEKWC